MKHTKPKILFILVLLLCLAPLSGQTYSRGAILDPVRYEQTDAEPVLVSRNYTGGPRLVSLKNYAPIPEDQGDYSTCVGWATAFAARTISESIALNRISSEQSSNSAYSPLYIYKSISNDPTGRSGTAITDALDLMKSPGSVKRLSTEKDMDFMDIFLSMYSGAQYYPISNYVRLFSNPRGVPGTISERVPPVKKSLENGMPVIIGMNCPFSFFIAEGVWEPWEDPYIDYGGHAMCVVGYNDDMYGGAFEVQNSWGTGWGNEGYIWITYSDFATFVNHAYKIKENLAMFKDATQYAASIEIEVYNDSRGMPVTYDRQGFYRTNLTYPEGTEFRFLMTNRYPAYVYAFSADNSSNDIERIFPTQGTSPVLDYIDSTVAWPSEYELMKLFGDSGTDYLAVLYSKEELDIDAIERRFAGERGTFPERVARAVGSNFIPYSQVQYNTNRIEFSAETQNPKSVFGLLVAIDRQGR
jgi:hypothetical protein